MLPVIYTMLAATYANISDWRILLLTWSWEHPQVSPSYARLRYVRL